MIVPRNRLIIWTAVVMISAAIMVVMSPSALPVAGTAAALFALIVLADALPAMRLLDGVSARYPEIVRLTKDREGMVDIEIESERAGPSELRLGIRFPPEIRSPREETDALLPAEVNRSFLRWPCTATTRGNYTLENIYLEAGSPMGFWAARKMSPSRASVRVYPNAMREQKKLAAIFLNRGTFGLHAQTMVGKGKEFEKLREYVPGDSYDDIHWKATAKRSRPITKVFQIERTQELYVIIDTSRLSAREVEMAPDANETTVSTQLERFISAALVLGLVAEKQGDLFGVLAFDEQVRAFVRARSGKAHYGACRESLYALTPKMANPDFGELASFIRLRLRRRALLIFLTNLDDPVLAENFVSNIDLLSRHHLILANMLKLPGTGPIFAPSKADGKGGIAPVENVDDIYRGLAGHIIWHKLRELEKVLRRRGVSMTLLDNEMMAPQLVSQYINVKRRQIL